MSKNGGRGGGNPLALINLELIEKSKYLFYFKIIMFQTILIFVEYSWKKYLFV